MLERIISWIRKSFMLIENKKKTTFTGGDFIGLVNEKIKKRTGINSDFINISDYEKYFNFLRDLKLEESFQLITHDSLILKGNYIRSPLVNKNNEKTIIFCHGITNNRWSLFYCVHLTLQLGYSVVIYDARNHGLSSKSYSSLGKIESEDLEGIINLVKNKFQPTKIAIYGFSMGSSTILFWLSNFQTLHPEVNALICEAVFDNFSQQLKFFLSNPLLGGPFFYSRKENYFFKIAKKRFLLNKKEAFSINPSEKLPHYLRVKLLLLHGLDDKIISWKSSFNIWKHFRKDIVNHSWINAYFFLYADHGEVPFLGDSLINNLKWIRGRGKTSDFSYSSLIYEFLEKNL